MPGVAGVVRSDGQQASVARMMRKLSHVRNYESIEMQPSAGVSLGVVYRKSRTREFDWCFDHTLKIGVLLYGIAIQADLKTRVVNAADVLYEYKTYGGKHWNQFDGGFLIVIVDMHYDQLLIMNDRLGVLPLYYALGPTVFAFAPEAKGVLVNAEFAPKLSNEGVVNFLSAGYCFGDLTLFEGVKRLEPATLLSLKLSNLAVQKRQLWRIVYEPAPELGKRRVAAETLSQAILEACGRVLCDTPLHVALLLSGGWDSRGILAALQKNRRLPDLAQGWGLHDDIPGSDSFIASRLAAKFDVPFLFCSYDTDGFLENAARWCYLSELATDTLGWFAEGAGFLSTFYDPAIDVMLVGDEAWGWGGYVTNEMEARAAVFPPRLPAALQKILREPFVHDAYQMYDDAITSISRHCQNADFVDRKDFMYLHGRIARFIFSLGYYKEFFTPIRRPFLSNAVLEVVRRLPRQYRLWKNLYISTLYQHFSSVTFIPTSSVSSLPDWASDLRQKQSLRRFLLNLLNFQRLEQGLVGHLLDRSTFEQLLNDFLMAQVGPTSLLLPWSKAFRGSKIEHRATRSLWLNKAVHVLRPAMGAVSTSTFNIICRLALLSILQEQLGDLSSINKTISLTCPYD
jgi:hypothetical protein